MTAVAGCGSGPDIQVTEDRLMAALALGGVTKTVTAPLPPNSTAPWPVITVILLTYSIAIMCPLPIPRMATSENWPGRDGRPLYNDFRNLIKIQMATLL